MNRRAFLMALSGSLLGAPLAAEAQQAGKVYWVGYLSGSSGSSPHLAAAFREGLRDRGWVEGQNVIIEYRWARGIEERYPTLVAELVGLKVDQVIE